MKVINIIGSIGVGKSTLLNNLLEYTIRNKDKLPYEIIPVFECVERYQSFNGYDPLFLSYENPIANAAITQAHIIASVNEHLHTILSKISTGETTEKEKIVIMDRSLFSPVVFNQVLLNRGIISHFARDYLWSEAINSGVKTMSELNLTSVGVISLSAPTDVCLRRIMQRSRDCEVKYVSSDYLKSLKEEYNRHVGWWYTKIPSDYILEIDTESANQDQLLSLTTEFF